MSTSPAGTEPRTTTFARAELMAGRAEPLAPEVDAIRLVSAGRPVDQHVCIVDPLDGAAQGEHEVGEVWVHGPNVAAGYWDQAAGGASAFDGRLRDGGEELPVGGWLRTGDHGVRYAGELYITGRLKDMIIVDGKNHYPQDIEETVQHAHPAVRTGCVAAFGIPVEDEGAEVMAVALERERRLAAAVPAQEIVRAVRRAVSAHDLRLADVEILEGRKVLRTSSGKIARAANRDRYLAERGAMSGSGTAPAELERWLVRVVGERCGFDPEEVEPSIRRLRLLLPGRGGARGAPGGPARPRPAHHPRLGSPDDPPPGHGARGAAA